MWRLFQRGFAAYRSSKTVRTGGRIKPSIKRSSPTFSQPIPTRQPQNGVERIKRVLVDKYPAKSFDNRNNSITGTKYKKATTGDTMHDKRSPSQVQDKSASSYRPSNGIDRKPYIKREDFGTNKEQPQKPYVSSRYSSKDREPKNYQSKQDSRSFKDGEKKSYTRTPTTNNGQRVQSTEFKRSGKKNTRKPAKSIDTNMARRMEPSKNYSRAIDRQRTNDERSQKNDLVKTLRSKESDTDPIDDTMKDKKKVYQGRKVKQGPFKSNFKTAGSDPLTIEQKTQSEIESNKKEVEELLKAPMLLLSIQEHLFIVKHSHLIEMEAEAVMELYRGFLLQASRRITLTPSHFNAFRALLLRPYLSSTLERHFGVARTAQKELDSKVEIMLQTIDADSSVIGLDEDLSTELILAFLKGNYEKVDEIEALGTTLNANAYNCILDRLCQKVIHSENKKLVDRDEDVFVISKRRLWGIYTASKLDYTRDQQGILQNLLYLFATHLKDPKSTLMLHLKFQKPNLLSLILLVDSLAWIDAVPQKMDKLVHQYREKYKIGRYEGMIRALIRFWSFKEKPYACFKLLAVAEKSGLVLGIDSVAMLLEMCHTFDKEEDIDIMKAHLEKNFSNETWTLWNRYLLKYGKYQLRDDFEMDEDLAQRISRVKGNKKDNSDVEKLDLMD